MHDELDEMIHALFCDMPVVQPNLAMRTYISWSDKSKIKIIIADDFSSLF
jgi:hypothetical protein